MSSERINRCPNCGASLSVLDLKCPECGYSLTAESDSSKIIRDTIAELQSLLVDEKDPRKKATIISSFTMPSTEDGLLNLLVYSYSSFEQSNGREDEKVSAAWLEKAKQTYQIIKLKASSDRQIMSKIEEYSFLEMNGSSPKVKEAKSLKKRRSIIRWVVAVVLVCLGVYLFLLILSNMDEPDPTTDLRKEVLELIQAGKYDEARLKAAEAEYSWDQKELLEMIEKDENKN